MRRYAAIPGFLAAWALMFSASSAVSKEKKLPDLTQACAKECPNLASNEDVLKCIDDMEAKSGEKAFKKEHKSCYKAHEKYEKMTGKEEAKESHG